MTILGVVRDVETKLEKYLQKGLELLWEIILEKKENEKKQQLYQVLEEDRYLKK